MAVRILRYTDEEKSPVDKHLTITMLKPVGGASPSPSARHINNKSAAASSSLPADKENTEWPRCLSLPITGGVLHLVCKESEAGVAPAGLSPSCAVLFQNLLRHTKEKHMHLACMFPFICLPILCYLLLTVHLLSLTRHSLHPSPATKPTRHFPYSTTTTSSSLLTAMPQLTCFTLSPTLIVNSAVPALSLVRSVCVDFHFFTYF